MRLGLLGQVIFLLTLSEQSMYAAVGYERLEAESVPERDKASSNSDACAVLAVAKGAGALLVAIP